MHEIIPPGFFNSELGKDMTEKASAELRGKIELLERNHHKLETARDRAKSQLDKAYKIYRAAHSEHDKRDALCNAACSELDNARKTDPGLSAYREYCKTSTIEDAVTRMPEEMRPDIIPVWDEVERLVILRHKFAPKVGALVWSHYEGDICGTRFSVHGEPTRCFILTCAAIPHRLLWKRDVENADGRAFTLKLERTCMLAGIEVLCCDCPSCWTAGELRHLDAGGHYEHEIRNHYNEEVSQAIRWYKPDPI